LLRLYGTLTGVKARVTQIFSTIARPLATHNALSTKFCEIEQYMTELLEDAKLGAIRHVRFGRKWIFAISWPPKTNVAAT